MTFISYTMRRLIYIIPMLLITTFIVFSLILLIPGDPAITLLGSNATPENIALIQKELGLDESVMMQYIDWLKNAIQGDLGKSIFTGQLVHELVINRLLVTFQLVIVSLGFAVVGGIFFALVSIAFPNSLLDHFSRFLGTLGAAIPNFWLALLLIILLSLKLDLVPATGFVSIFDSPILFFQGILVPAISLGMVGVAQITRHLRSSMIEVMNSDYIRTVYSKGFNKWSTIFRHGLQNAMLPVITTIGILFGNLLGATVVIETIFAIPGMGQLAVNSILQRDFTVLQGVILVMIIMIVIINFITDLVYQLLDPRIDYK